MTRFDSPQQQTNKQTSTLDTQPNAHTKDSNLNVTFWLKRLNSDLKLYYSHNPPSTLNTTRHMQTLRKHTGLFHSTDQELMILHTKIRALLYHPGHEKDGIHRALFLLEQEKLHRAATYHAYRLDVTKPRRIRQWYWEKTNRRVAPNPDGDPIGLDDDHPTKTYEIDFNLK